MEVSRALTGHFPSLWGNCHFVSGTDSTLAAGSLGGSLFEILVGRFADGRQASPVGVCRVLPAAILGVALFLKSLYF